MMRSHCLCLPAADSWVGSRPLVLSLCRCRRHSRHTYQSVPEPGTNSPKPRDKPPQALGQTAPSPGTRSQSLGPRVLRGFFRSQAPGLVKHEVPSLGNRSQALGPRVLRGFFRSQAPGLVKHEVPRLGTYSQALGQNSKKARILYKKKQQNDTAAQDPHSNTA